MQKFEIYEYIYRYIYADAYIYVCTYLYTCGYIYLYIKYSHKTDQWSSLGKEKGKHKGLKGLLKKEFNFIIYTYQNENELFLYFLNHMHYVFKTGN